jgi:hypothetical protein
MAPPNCNVPCGVRRRARDAAYELAVAAFNWPPP